jgi:hypothetical protein
LIVTVLLAPVLIIPDATISKTSCSSTEPDGTLVSSGADGTLGFGNTVSVVVAIVCVAGRTPAIAPEVFKGTAPGAPGAVAGP